ncbi:hypothetical protein CEXT_40471 [Caerostris extrusa]|uniref:Uncharacterized protein n=1 Tax=Caerostris extrusa TaxID=172846 RepID=A0AAV4Y810_CAEEX|nr:hypothetical protein CEXT_40471 [Caerostris extrusa]
MRSGSCCFRHVNEDYPHTSVPYEQSGVVEFSVLRDISAHHQDRVKVKNLSERQPVCWRQNETGEKGGKKAACRQYPVVANLSKSVLDRSWRKEKRLACPGLPDRSNRTEPAVQTPPPPLKGAPEPCEDLPMCTPPGAD